MTLKKYKEKRSFDQTPEPQGGIGDTEKLHFVVQKHDASRLHYDFRLEMKGVLKSWAVPKGPSLDPTVKRLAMMVEDHPYDYKDFEGIIPKGNYGAGTVIVWDEGTYEAIDGSEKKGIKAMENALLKKWKAGDLKFKLNGKKLKGEFALVKTSSDKMGENAWLLIKHRDKYISDKDITAQDKSVRSGKTIKKMEEKPEGVYGNKDAKRQSGESKETAKQKKVNRILSKKSASTGGIKKTIRKTAPKKTVKKKPEKSLKEETGSIKRETVERKAASKKAQAKNADITTDKGKNEAAKKVRMLDWRSSWRRLPTSPMPKEITPMLATLVDAPFDDPDWEFEVKWDGYRAIAYIDNRQQSENSLKEPSVKIMSRNQKPFELTYYPVKEILQQRKENMVIDGEIVVIDPKTGISRFNALQNWRSEADGQLMYYIFDVLWYEGKDLTSWPLSLRRIILNELFDNSDSIVRLGFSISGKGTQFFASTEALGLEGMIAKKLDSPYDPGVRTKAWLKIKVQKRQEVIIIGYTRNQGTSKLFSSLLLGVYEDKKLVYVGKVGTGFNDRQQKEMMQAFKPLQRKTSPLSKIPDYNKPSRFRPNPPQADATWLKPVLVGEVSYAERTEDGVFRHPSFKGMRKDKAAKEVVLEMEKETEDLIEVVGPSRSVGRENRGHPQNQR